MRLTANEIKAMLQEGTRPEALVRQLLPDGKRTGPRWMARNPTRADAQPGSFCVWVKNGAWKDYATGDKGSILDLIAYVVGTDTAGAVRYAKDFLGLRELSPRQLAQMKRRAAVDRQAAERAEHLRLAERQRRAFELWLGARQSISGTPAETYLAARGIPIADVPNPERGELRFSPDLEWWEGAVYTGAGSARRKTASGPRYPAIVAAIRDGRGAVTGVHCTYLAQDGAGKAPVDKPKLMFGAVKGGVIRLARGPSNMRVEDAGDAGQSGVLILCEGIEDGLSWALAVPDARVWAATSLSNLIHAPVWHPCVRAVVVGADNDWSRPQAMDALEAAVEGLESHDKPVAVARSHHGKDTNDLLRGTR